MHEFMRAFFVIDSRSLDVVEDGFYGYKITENGIYSAENIQGSARDVPGQVGCYVDVVVTDGKIRISQDNLGCFGLYIYRNADWFVLSNSFFRLVEYLQTRARMSFNWEYSELLLSLRRDMLYDQTSIREISIVDRNAVLSIDRKSRCLSISQGEPDENVVELDSSRGLSILDRWFEKWKRIMREIVSRTTNVSIDLSGGYDSRLTLLLMLQSGVDMRRVRVNSFTDGLHTHSRDYAIATDIANAFGFKLNARELDDKGRRYTPEERFNLSFYTKGGFHDEFYAPEGVYGKNVYSFTGMGGELIRDELRQDEKAWKVSLYSMLQKRSSEACRKMFEQSVLDVKRKYDKQDLRAQDVPRKCYVESRNRNHYGKVCVEAWLGHRFLLSPFFDPLILSLKMNTSACDDRYLLTALIYQRYCPELLKFPYDNGTSISPETLRQAAAINQRYPRGSENAAASAFSLPADSGATGDDIGIQAYDSLDRLMAGRFESASFQSEVSSVFGEYMCKNAKWLATNGGWYPLRMYYLMFALLKAKHAAEASMSCVCDPIDWIDGLTCFQKQAFPDCGGGLEGPNPAVRLLVGQGACYSKGVDLMPIRTGQETV